MRFHVENQKYSGAQIIVFNSQMSEQELLLKSKCSDRMHDIIWLKTNGGRNPLRIKFPLSDNMDF